MQSVDEAIASETARIGQLLHQARLKKGLQPEEVAGELRLQRRQVDWLEQGNFAAFSNPAFVKGYLRACARLYGMDGNGLVRMYESMLPEKEALPVRRSSPLSSPDRLMSGRRRLPSLSWLWVLPVFVLAICLVVNPAWFARWLPVGSAEETAAPVEESAIQPASVPATPAVNAVPPAEVGKQDAAADVAVDGEGVLHLEFVDDCWVQLKLDNGKVAHEKLHHKGEVFDMSVATPLHVWFGNGNAVNVSYNGVAVPVVVKTGFQSARFVIGDESSRNEAE